jgi:hypothetical protein
MSLGFIILRHVSSEEHNKLWIECYDCIREFYPLNKILIIDDSSNYEFVDTKKILSNTLLIQSEFPGRGELLPYYYYHQNKLFERAVILHDSVFIKHYINFGDENRFIWSFENHWVHFYNYDKLIENLNKKEILINMFNNKQLWKGCFGVMSVISHNFLCDINSTFNLFNLIQHITCRDDRMSLERLFAVIFTLCNINYNKETTSIFGDIHSYCTWGESYDIYKSKNKENLPPLVKVWSSR